MKKNEYFFLLQTHHRFFSHPYSNYLLSPQRLQYVCTILCWPTWTKIYIKYLKILRIIIFGSILLGIMFNFKYILSQQTNFLLKFQALKIKYFVTWTVKFAIRRNFYLLSTSSQLLQIVNLLLLQWYLINDKAMLCFSQIIPAYNSSSSKLLDAAAQPAVCRRRISQSKPHLGDREAQWPEQ